MAYLAWREVQEACDLPRGLSLLASITQIRNFVPLTIDSSFRNWGLKNERETLKTFKQLVTEFSFPDFYRYQIDFYRYLQVCSFLFKHPNWKKIKTSPLSIKLILIKSQTGNKILRAVSCIYREP